MNIESYTFEGKWILLEDTKPVNAQRVLLTDGDSIIIGSLTITDERLNWLFDRENLTGYNPIAWMELPNVNPTKRHSIQQ